MDKNNLIVHETDERTFYLKELLKGKNTDVPTHVFAPNVLIDVRTLTDVPDGSRIVCGRISQEASALSNSRDITVFDYGKDERFQAVNARLTAEGTLKAIIEHSQKSIADCHVLIIGFGRTGSAIARLLNKLDVTCDIATSSSVRPAHAFAKRVIAMKSFDFSGYDVVVNTAPAPIISDKEVMTMNKNAVYIELASVPAINLEYAQYLGIDADIYPALPAKTCPYSAGKAMFDYISEVIL